VLVTGAMGQVGKLLVALLQSRGHSVIAADLPTEANRTALAKLQESGRSSTGSLLFQELDITDANAVAEALRKHAPNSVIHLAAVVSPPCYRNPDMARRVNVEGTQHLVDAALALPAPPVFIFASSAGIYGSRNPYTHPERITPTTPPNPVDCYGEDKVAAEQIVRQSGLRHAVLRLGGVISPNAPSGPDYLLLMRAIPRDTRVHMVDARDVALAFANAADRIEAVNGKTLLIGGDESYVHTHNSVQDDVLDAVGIGRVGPSTNLPGNPDDDYGWSFTDWFDTTESQALLGFQAHHWSDTLQWVRASSGRRRIALRVAGPLARPLMRTGFRIQRRRDGRGEWADPWRLIEQTYGEHVMAATATLAARGLTP
jgi:nucleoside-diphosphate-sugar epimerase